MGKIGGWEWLVILFIVLILFGANKLPAMGKGLGEGIRNFRNAFKSGSDGDEKDGEGKVEKKGS